MEFPCPRKCCPVEQHLDVLLVIEWTPHVLASEQMLAHMCCLVEWLPMEWHTRVDDWPWARSTLTIPSIGIVLGHVILTFCQFFLVQQTSWPHLGFSLTGFFTVSYRHISLSSNEGIARCKKETCAQCYDMHGSCTVFSMGHRGAILWVPLWGLGIRVT